MFLTDEQADKFVREKLGIPDWKTKLSTSKFELFLEIDKRVKLEIYYENITWGSKPFDQLQPPSIEESIRLILENGAGACLQNNFVIYLLYKYLGYDTLLLGSQTFASNVPNDHAMFIVRFPKTNMGNGPNEINFPPFKTHDYYLSDVGWVRPIPEPILLNQLPHVFISGGYRIEHRFNEETKMVEIHFHEGDPLKGPLKDALSMKYCEIEIIPRTFEDFNNPMSQIYTNQNYGYFLHAIALSRFLSLERKESYEFVSILGRTITTVTPKKSDHKRFEKYADMFSEIIKYFPNLNHETLLQALDNYEERQAHRKREN